MTNTTNNSRESLTSLLKKAEAFLSAKNIGKLTLDDLDTLSKFIDSSTKAIQKKLPAMAPIRDQGSRDSRYDNYPSASDRVGRGPGYAMPAYDVPVHAAANPLGGEITAGEAAIYDEEAIIRQQIKAELGSGNYPPDDQFISQVGSEISPETIAEMEGLQTIFEVKDGL